MAVTGWSDYGKRGWGSTTGDESGTIVSDDGGGQNKPLGLLTRDQNNGIGDFEFVVDILKTEPWGTDNHGGISFSVQDSTHFLAIMWKVKENSETILTAYENPTDGRGSSGTSLGSVSAGSGEKAFALKVTKVGDTYTVYHGVNVSSFIQAFSFTYSSYPTGNLGFVYPGETWAGNDTEYKFVSVVGGAPVQRRRIMVIT